MSGAKPPPPKEFRCLRTATSGTAPWTPQPLKRLAKLLIIVFFLSNTADESVKKGDPMEVKYPSDLLL